MCFSRAQSAMIFCHSAIERPYFFSMDGKYDAGPCLGHGADCSARVESSFELKVVAVQWVHYAPFSSARSDIDLPADAEPVDESSEGVAPEHLLEGSLHGSADTQRVEDSSQITLIGTD